MRSRRSGRAPASRIVVRSYTARLAVRRGLPVHPVAQLTSRSIPTSTALSILRPVIANGYLRLDPQEWIRAVEKRRAALGRLIDV